MTALNSHNLSAKEPSEGRLQNLSRAAVRSRHNVSYILFVVLTGNLFIRPLELIPDLRSVRIHEILTLACLALLLPTIILQMRLSTLLKQPAKLCVLAFIVAIDLSNLLRGSLWGVRQGTIDLLQPLLVFLFLLLLIDSPARFRNYLKWMTVFISITALLSIIQLKGIVDLHADEYGISSFSREDHIDAVSGNAVEIQQLSGSGIFSDPNDLSLVLVAASLLSITLALNGRGVQRLIWFGLFVFLLYSFALTQSRGGFLSLIAGYAAFVFSMWGRRRALLASIVLLPLILVLFAGRQTRIDLNDRDDTAQGRILLWREAMMHFRTSPIFGIGYGRLEEEMGYVAHNSFVHSFAELGVVGGTCFIGAFYCAIKGLRPVRNSSQDREGPNKSAMDIWRPCIVAMTIGYSVGLWSLTRSYAMPTFLILGIATAYAAIAAKQYPSSQLYFNARLAGEIGLVSFMSLVCIFVFIKVFAAS